MCYCLPRDGNDGPWSTFDIRVGTPPQPMKVLISTESYVTSVISATKPSWCRPDSPADCPQNLVGLFHVNASSTWRNASMSDSGYNSGLDTLGLGLPTSTSVELKSQMISALTTGNVSIGSLGLAPRHPSFTTSGRMDMAFLPSLKFAHHVPSLSYGYSAGARYRMLMQRSQQLGFYLI